jgi:hypothetical protein
MADVRSLLRAERAARAPPKTGKQPLTSPPKQNKKRKADEDSTKETRKRTKGTGSQLLPSGFFDATRGPEFKEEKEEVEEVVEPEAPLEGFVAATETPPSLPQSTFLPTAPDKNLDEEWAAFEQDIASIPAPAKSALDALNASAVLEAAPISAADAASQFLSNESPTAKNPREEEIEAEREDASRALEDEFDEMEVLEERLKKLKEKREQIRAGKSEGAEHIVAQPEAVPEDRSDEDDDDDGDEWDGWRFGAS